MGGGVACGVGVFGKGGRPQDMGWFGENWRVEFARRRLSSRLLKLENARSLLFPANQKNCFSFEPRQPFFCCARCFFFFRSAYYEFEVSEGDVLLFNNSACIHKFMNLTENPEIFTMRLFITDASPLTLKNDLFNWTGAKYFTGILMDGGTHARKTDSV